MKAVALERSGATCNLKNRDLGDHRRNPAR
jgi:hypothetical protein